MESAYQRLKKKYPKIKNEILLEYQEADKYVVMNEDPDLHPVYIPLPEPPPEHEIDGFGLPAKKQKFKRFEMPQKLQSVVQACDTIEEIWEEIANNQTEYYDEIEWIQNMWHNRLYGYWCYINGKPTFIDGWHFTYINFWHFEDGTIPEYRDRNRKFFHSMRYAYTTTETVVYDEFKRPVYEDAEKRIIKMQDTGLRTFNGITYPKHRRDGASNMCACAMYCETTIRFGVGSGIVSMTGEHAQTKIFNEIVVPGWQQMPFFFKPIYAGNEKPGDELLFYASRKKAVSKLREQLRSRIDWSPTATSSYYDGGKKLWILVDETGKTVECQSYMRHQQLKNCVAQGNGSNITGFLTYPSTVGEMKGIGGQYFFALCQDSKFDKRDVSGQTKTGMLTLYISACEGLEGFIDEYGNSVVDTPTKSQSKFIRKSYGSREYLESKRNAFLEDGDMEAYNEEVRLFPLRYMECFRTEDGEIGFNTKIINDRLDILAYEGKGLVRQGNFKRENGDPEGRVYWEDDPKGRWFVSQLLRPEFTNRWYWEGEHRFPIGGKYTASSDTFKFNKVQHKRMSNGGGAVFWHYDQEVDGNTKAQNWKSNRFVCTYNFRPATTDEYAEDMLMMCIYYGAMMYPESNIPKIWEYFEARSYGGFLKFDIDIKTGKPKNTPGFNSEGNNSTKQDLFNSLRDYIERHGMRECHADLLVECKEIKTIMEMTDYDLLTAAGGCLLGAKGEFIKLAKPVQPKSDIGDYFQPRSYKGIG